MQIILRGDKTIGAVVDENQPVEKFDSIWEAYKGKFKKNEHPDVSGAQYSYNGKPLNKKKSLKEQIPLDEVKEGMVIEYTSGGSKSPKNQKAQTKSQPAEEPTIAEEPKESSSPYERMGAI